MTGFRTAINEERKAEVDRKAALFRQMQGPEELRGRRLGRARSSDEQRMIDEFMDKRGVTECPPGYAMGIRKISFLDCDA